MKTNAYDTIYTMSYGDQDERLLVVYGDLANKSRFLGKGDYVLVNVRNTSSNRLKLTGLMNVFGRNRWIKLVEDDKTYEDSDLLTLVKDLEAA